MADKVKHIQARSSGVWGKINEIIDAVNELRVAVEELREEKAKPARRAPKSTSSDKE